MIRTFFDRLSLGLSFLSRLGPARMASPEELAATLPLFPVIGLVIALSATALPLLGLFSEHPMLQAWYLVGASLFLTRGLHWDGWADLWDGLGSGARGEEFWLVLKDSRMGACGVMALVLGLVAQGLLFFEMCRCGDLGAVIWSLVNGRLAMVFLAGASGRLSRPGLGRHFVQAADARALFLALGLSCLVALFCISLAVFSLSLVFHVLVVIVLHTLAMRVQGFNGDFLGAVCVAGELAAGLAWLWMA